MRESDMENKMGKEFRELLMITVEHLKKNPESIACHK